MSCFAAPSTITIRFYAVAASVIPKKGPWVPFHLAKIGLDVILSRDFITSTLYIFNN